MNGTQDPTQAVVTAQQRLGALGVPVPSLVPIQPGTFYMGSASGSPSEAPPHLVTLTAFSLSATPVTAAAFAAFVAATHYLTEAERVGPDQGGWVRDPATGQMARRADACWQNPYSPPDPAMPVVVVTWHDACAYAEWLSAQTGLRFDLPSEAWWEYACRAGSVGDFGLPCLGLDELDTFAWTARNSHARLQLVGQKGPNAWGLHDMHGLVWEWTLDSYAPYAGPATPLLNPVFLADTGQGRVARGGSWNFPPEVARAAFRQGGHSTHARAQDLGFRLALQIAS
jgi:formylglycine-generating enzyme required for sulfatase activity